MANTITSAAVLTLLSSANQAEMRDALDLATYLASPDAIGGVTAAAGRFTEAAANYLLIGSPSGSSFALGGIYLNRSANPFLVLQGGGNRLGQIRGIGASTDGGIQVTNGDSTSLWAEFTVNSATITQILKLTDGRVRPDADSSESIRFQNASGTASLLTLDTTKNTIDFNYRQVQDAYLAGAHFEGGFVGYQPIIDRLLGANMRYSINVTGSVTDLDNLWDSSNESRTIVAANTTAVIEIDFRNADAGSQGFTFANGQIVITPYHTSVPQSMTVEIERNHNTTPEWLTIASLTSLESYRATVVQVTQHTFVGRIRFTIEAQSGLAAEMVKIQWFASRSNETEPTRGILSRRSGVQKVFSAGLRVSNADESLYAELRQGLARTSPMSIASLPSLTTGGGFAFVSDGSRPNRPVYYDGSDWRYFSDDTIVS
ncbi:hypothetical protein N836_28905 [Leptolyngbya sp. Heron Island J]|uniref:hypothetical protein n=1 Tax=Leptolyngbya sp. Heron Island J TaxID=1385935 RepID=UPI0003B9CCDE|nr:hypothetical protein [Leptolyngbya sp. Heron Island J]ESA39098.1 hypothetical protein N836_28905 [Leptolyngbya sp. Heron Island J]